MLESCVHNLQRPDAVALSTVAFAHCCNCLAVLDFLPPPKQDKAMATHMICQIASHLGAAFSPYVPAILPKFLPLVSLSHATYAELRAYAVESLHHVRPLRVVGVYVCACVRSTA